MFFRIIRGSIHSGQPAQDVVDLAEQRAGVGERAVRVVLRLAVEDVDAFFLTRQHQVRFVAAKQEAVDVGDDVIPRRTHVAALVGEQRLALVDAVLDPQNVLVLDRPRHVRQVRVLRLLGEPSSSASKMRSVKQKALTKNKLDCEQAV
jgi:hypothetical protein